MNVRPVPARGGWPGDLSKPTPRVYTRWETGGEETGRAAQASVKRFGACRPTVSSIRIYMHILCLDSYPQHLKPAIHEGCGTNVQPPVG